MMLYSIIIPTRNSANTIKKCLLSVVNQSCGDYEIIVADGISADNTLEIVNEFSDKRITVFSEKDSGVYDAMNKAITIASGKWCLFLGSDDYLYDNEVLNSMKKVLSSTTAKLVYGNVKIVGDTPWAKDGDIYRNKISLPDLMSSNICHQSIFYNKDVFKDRKYDLRYPVCADWDFNLYCASKYKCQHHQLTISYFSAGGMSTINSDTLFDEEKWQRIVLYFKLKLTAKQFVRYRNLISKAAVKFIKNSALINAMLALSIFTVLLFKRVFL